MTVPYLVMQFGWWMAGAAVLGLVVGAFAARSRREKSLERADGWFWVYLVLLAAGIVVAGTRVVLGEAGLWVDTLVIFFGLYLLGCLVGGALARPMRHQGAKEASSAG